MSRWFRWYDGTSEDGKFRVVARISRVTVRDVIALWAFMLEDASNLAHRGVCERNEDFMAGVLDFEDGAVEGILSAMESAGMISVGIGAITICNWGKRQFEGDTDPTAAERQRRHRSKTKPVTNAPVTRDSRPPDTDTDTDTEKKIREPRAKRATRLPNDWVLSENDRTFALGKGLPMQRVQIEALKFLNYWTAKGGQGATKTDWSKTWQNWILTATQGVPTNGRRTVHDAARDLHEQTVAAVLAFDEPAPRSLCDGTGPDVIRLLPPGRRQ